MPSRPMSQAGTSRIPEFVQAEAARGHACETVALESSGPPRRTCGPLRAAQFPGSETGVTERGIKDVGQEQGDRDEGPLPWSVPSPQGRKWQRQISQTSGCRAILGNPPKPTPSHKTLPRAPLLQLGGERKLFRPAPCSQVHMPRLGRKKLVWTPRISEVRPFWTRRGYGTFLPKGHRESHRATQIFTSRCPGLNSVSPKFTATQNLRM